ncbi:MAG: acylphosphatase [Candidatus Micrarchaeota archaeon]
MERLHIIITGKVQGVFFRANAKEQADRLGVKGFVQNLCDGGVEVIAEGERKDLEELLDWCYHGPAEAKVTDIEFGWLQPKNEFRSFEIRR